MKFTAKTVHCGAPLSHAIYHGTNSDGRHRIMINGEKNAATAVLYEIVLKKKRDAKAGSIRRLVSTTPGYEKGAEGEMSFIAQCPKSKKRYRLIGWLKSCSEKPALPEPLVPVALVVEPAMPTATTSEVDKIISKATASEGKVLKKNRSRAVHERHACARELERIAAHRASGLDPDLRMEFIVDYLGESRATLYRKMGKSFPMPIKRGKGSFWPMSQIDAYKAGTYLGAQQ